MLKLCSTSKLVELQQDVRQIGDGVLLSKKGTLSIVFGADFVMTYWYVVASGAASQGSSTQNSVR